jgi:phosphoribosylformimino-5-aminoimidazole carboxamide ribotide isomerase
MLILPEIQISEGRVVTRVSPSADNIVHDIDPRVAVRQFAEQGAERVHVLDVDAALGREQTNADLIARIIGENTVPIQVAGGMRTFSHVEGWLEAGASHVVLGTLSITNQPLLAEVCSYHPSAIIANVATKDGFVMIDGWQTQTAYRPQDIVYDLQMAGVAGIIHFDIDRRFGDASTSLALTMEMKANVVIPVYSSGTVHSLDDIARLRHLPNIHGVIVGEALLSGTFTLPEALEMANQRYESVEPEMESPLATGGLRHPVKVYLAAYNVSPAARWWNLDLRQAITDDSPFVEVFIPQEDLEADPDSLSPRELQAAYESMVDDVDVVAVVLDGIASEAWTGFECGYARARGKYLLGIATGAENSNRSRFEAMCDDVVVFDASEDRQQTLAAIAKEVNSLLLVKNEVAA